jgi:hypothetical protein
MALTKISPSGQNGHPSQSALQTFATIMNIGTSLGGLANQVSGAIKAPIRNPNPAPQGTYSLGTNLDLSGGSVNPAWMDIYQKPYFTNIGQTPKLDTLQVTTPPVVALPPGAHGVGKRWKD